MYLCDTIDLYICIYLCDRPVYIHVYKTLLNHHKALDQSKQKAFADDKINLTKKKNLLGREFIKNIEGKGFLYEVIKSCICAVLD